MRDSDIIDSKLKGRKIVKCGTLVLILCYMVYLLMKVSRPTAGVIIIQPDGVSNVGQGRHSWRAEVGQAYTDNVAARSHALPDAAEADKVHRPFETLLEAAKSVQKERQVYMWRQCNGYKGVQQQNGTYVTTIPRVTSIDKDHPILYCPVQKVASSFWVRLLTVIGSKGRYHSPFEITVKDRTLQSFHKINKDLTTKQSETFLSELFTFMFVRCPYSRLFSAYVDKVYFPNTVFWPDLTDEINAMVYGETNQTSLGSLSHVTFSDFIKYILKMAEEDRPLDKHFAQLHKMCDPCALRYKFLGKLETFIQDTEFLLDKWRNKFNDINVSFTDFPREAMLDDTRRHVSMLFSVIASTPNPSVEFIYSILNRGWLNLKIRGYIDKNINFPYKISEVRSLTMNIYMTTFLKINSEKPLTVLESKNQRAEALVQAYRTVNKQDLEKLRLFVQPDCKLFDYGDRPAKVFDRDFEISTFDFFQDVKTS